MNSHHGPLSVCLSVCLFVRTIKPKRLKLKSQRVHHDTSTTFKGQRSRLGIGLALALGDRVAGVSYAVHLYRVLL